MNAGLRLNYRAKFLRHSSKVATFARLASKNERRVSRRIGGPANRPSFLSEGRGYDLHSIFECLRSQHDYEVKNDCSDEIMGCIKQGNFSEAEEAFGLMAKKGVNLEIRAYTGMIKGYSYVRDTNRIMELLDEMQDRGLNRDADVFNAAIQVWSIDEDVEELLALFETMKSEYGLKPNSYTYDHLLEKCAEAEDSGAARRVCREMLSSCVHPYSIMLYTVIKTYSKCCTEETAAQYLEDCRALIKQKRRIGINASKATYKIVLNICVQGGLAQEAVDLLNEMSRKSMHLENETIHIALRACTKAGDLDNALQMLDESKRIFWCSPIKYTYALILKICVNNKDLKTAKQMFEEMCEFRVEDNSVIRNMLLEVYADCCDMKNVRECLEKSQEVMNKMKGKGVQPDLMAYNTLLKTCARGGFTNEALSILEEMKTKELSPNVVSYNTIIDGLSKDESLSNERIQALSMELLEAIKKEEI